MKSIKALLLAGIIALLTIVNVSAQASESIWLTASTTSFKTGETVVVDLNAASATPIQGFTFQVRYDPACLKPLNAASSIPGMNGLSLPQVSGLVDGSYASTTPQAVNGVLAEIRFVTLKGCQTNLTLESAALAIRNAQGFAAPVANVTLGTSTIALDVSKEAGAAQADQPVSGSVLSLEAPPPPTTQGFGWAGIALVIVLIGGLAFGAIKLFRVEKIDTLAYPTPVRNASLHMKHGPQAGRNFVINKVPFMIGRDPQSDICINDPHVISQHAKIFTRNNGYYLMDLGGETFVNGQAIRRSSAVLRPGDVVRLGKSALFVFGS